MRKYNSCTAASFTHYNTLVLTYKCAPHLYPSFYEFLVKIPCMTSHQSHKALKMRIKLVNIIFHMYESMYTFTRLVLFSLSEFHIRINSPIVIIADFACLHINYINKNTRGQFIENMYCQVAPWLSLFFSLSRSTRLPYYYFRHDMDFNFPRWNVRSFMYI